MCCCYNKSKYPFAQALSRLLLLLLLLFWIRRCGWSYKAKVIHSSFSSIVRLCFSSPDYDFCIRFFLSPTIVRSPMTILIIADFWFQVEREKMWGILRQRAVVDGGLVSKRGLQIWDFSGITDFSIFWFFFWKWILNSLSGGHDPHWFQQGATQLVQKRYLSLYPVLSYLCWEDDLGYS